jgi:hypothetical protein
MVPALKCLFGVALLLLVTSAGVRAQTPEVPSRREVLAAIATLEERFLSPEAVRAAEVVTRFVELSEDCLILLDPEAIPWAEDSELTRADDPEDMLRSLLLAAYFAGNTKAQLDSGKVEDMPYPGWLFVIRAYKSIQEKTEFRIESIEQFIAMEEQGTLERFARILKARRDAGPDEPAEII